MRGWAVAMKGAAGEQREVSRKLRLASKG